MLVVFCEFISERIQEFEVRKTTIQMECNKVLAVWAKEIIKKEVFYV
jgi:hypothetical protein